MLSTTTLLLFIISLSSINTNPCTSLPVNLNSLVTNSSKTQKIQSSLSSSISSPLPKRFYRHFHTDTSISHSSYSSYSSYQNFHSPSRISSINSNSHYRRLLQRSSRTPADGTSADEAERSVEAYDPETGESRSISNKTSNNEQTDGSGSTVTDSNVNGRGSFFQYDTKNLVFFNERQPEINVLDGSIVSDNLRFVYLIGGIDNNTNEIVNITQRFDDDIGRWNILTAELNIPRILPIIHHFDTTNYRGPNSQGILFVISGCIARDVNDCLDGNNYNNNKKNRTRGNSRNNFENSIEYLDLDDIDQGWVLLDNNRYRIQTPRIGGRSITDGFDNIWIIGGYDGKQALDSIETILINFDRNGRIIINIINNFGKLAISRASFALGHRNYDTGYSCAIVLGGRTGIGSFQSLEVTDKIEYICYMSPEADNCENNEIIIENITYFDDCENDEWYINGKYNCQYHSIISFNELITIPPMMKNETAMSRLITGCYHGPFGNDISNLTRIFEISDNGNNRGRYDKYDIEISLDYFTMCNFDENDGDEVFIYFNNELKWRSTHELGICDKRINGWESFNWSGTFIETDPFLYQCVDNGNDIADVSDLVCVKNVKINIYGYRDETFMLTLSGKVSDEDTIKNWGWSDLKVIAVART